MKFDIVTEGSCPVEQKAYQFSELKPIRKLDCGIGVYDRSSFPETYPVERVEVPYDPQILSVDSLKVSDKRGNSIDMGQANVLTVHGRSNDSRWDSLKDGRQIADIVASIEREGMRIDYLHVCNPGGYRFPLADGRSSISYPLNVSNGSVFRDEKGLRATLQSENIRIRGKQLFEITR